MRLQPARHGAPAQAAAGPSRSEPAGAPAVLRSSVPDPNEAFVPWMSRLFPEDTPPPACSASTCQRWVRPLLRFSTFALLPDLVSESSSPYASDPFKLRLWRCARSQPKYHLSARSFLSWLSLAGHTSTMVTSPRGRPGRCMALLSPPDFRPGHPFAAAPGLAVFLARVRGSGHWLLVVLLWDLLFTEYFLVLLQPLAPSS